MLADMWAQRPGPHASAWDGPEGQFPAPEPPAGGWGLRCSLVESRLPAPNSTFLPSLVMCLLRMLPSKPSWYSFASQTLFPGNINWLLSSKAFRILEDVMEYIRFWEKKSCVRVPIAPSQTKTKQNKTKKLGKKVSQ